MLAEIEDKLVKILQEGVKEIPSENILLNVEPTKFPAVAITNMGFEFENLGLSENIDEGSLELEEIFSSDGVKTSYKLKENPLKDSIRIECPPGTSLAENKDFTVNYDEGSIGFRKAPAKGKDNISAKYLSKKRTLTMKSLKVKATYSIDVWSADRVEVDSVAEKVVKALLTVEDELATEGFELRPIGGEIMREQKGEKTERVRLKYMFERELHVKKLVPPIEKIEITKKKPLAS